VNRERGPLTPGCWWPRFSTIDDPLASPGRRDRLSAVRVAVVEGNPLEMSALPEPSPRGSSRRSEDLPGYVLSSMSLRMVGRRTVSGRFHRVDAEALQHITNLIGLIRRRSPSTLESIVNVSPIARGLLAVARGGSLCASEVEESSAAIAAARRTTIPIIRRNA
jgi:hypothetical protein